MIELMFESIHAAIWSEPEAIFGLLIAVLCFALLLHITQEDE